jgi:FtsZ-interacting cell division protein ZipA
MELESEDARFADIIITIQLADNNGAINEKELQQFEQVVANLSEGTGRGFSFMAPAASALQQAQCIHDFVRFYESVFVVNVRPSHSEYLEGGSINRCATQLGLEAGPGKFFVRNKTVGKKKVCLYSLANMSDSGEFDFENIRDLQTAGVTFFTKPAVNRSPGAVFSEMVDSAKAFAARIKGEAKAPNSDDLTQDDIDRIRQSIEKVAMEMENCGMAPGSEEAMRLF